MTGSADSRTVERMSPKLINSTAETVPLQYSPEIPPLAVTVFPDWRAAPNDGAALTSVLVLMILAQQQAIAMLHNRVASLEIHAAETARPQDVAHVGELPPPNDRGRDERRLALALRGIVANADALQLNKSPASALDRIDLA